MDDDPASYLPSFQIMSPFDAEVRVAETIAFVVLALVLVIIVVPIPCFLLFNAMSLFVAKKTIYSFLSNFKLDLTGFCFFPKCRVQKKHNA